MFAWLVGGAASSTVDRLGCGFVQSFLADATPAAEVKRAANGSYQIELPSRGTFPVDFANRGNAYDAADLTPVGFYDAIAAIGSVGRADLAAAVEWSDEQDPLLAANLSLPRLQRLLASDELLGDTIAPAPARLAEWRAACLAARLLALGSSGCVVDEGTFAQCELSGTNGSLNSADPFPNRHTRELGEPPSDACVWEAAARGACSGLDAAETLMESALYHPLYAGSTWAELQVGATLSHGAEASPFDLFDDLPLNVSEPTSLAAGRFANDFTLGGTFAAANYSGPGRLQANNRDEALNAHIHTWEVHPDHYGKLTDASQLIAYDHRVTYRNAQCYEPLDAAPDPSCVGGARAAPLTAGCVREGDPANYSFAHCLVHPLRFARARVFRGCDTTGVDQCTHSASLLVTSDAAKCARYNALAPAWACVLLPSPMRIYHGGTRPDQDAEAAAIWSVAQYEQVLIEDLTLDVLPHPKLGEFEELDADETLSDEERLEWLLPHQANEHNGALHYGTPNAKFSSYDLGDATTLSGTEKWARLKAALPIGKRLEPTGAVFAVHDVEHLTVQRVNIRGLTSEAMLHVRAARDATFVANHLEGQRANRLKALGLPVDDGTVGLSALQPSYLAEHFADLSDVRLMGGGLFFNNGKNGHTAPGLHCCLQRTTDYEHVCADANCTYRLLEGCDPRHPEATLDATTLASVSQAELSHQQPSYCVAANASCDNRATLVAGNTIRGCNLNNMEAVGRAATLSNHDGIGLMSVPGLVFNNELYDWGVNLNSELRCDSLIDVANRRPCDRTWTGKQMRLERNVLSAGVAKTQGPGETENSVTWANGVYSGVHFQDYHAKWHDYYLHGAWQYPFDTLTHGKAYVWNEAGRHPSTWHDSGMHIHANLMRSGAPSLFPLFRSPRSSVGYIELSANLFVSSHNLQAVTKADAHLVNGDDTPVVTLYSAPAPATNLSALPAAPPEEVCMREVVVGAWLCFDAYGLPPANWTSIFSLRTAHGMHYDLGELGHRYVGRDGQVSQDASVLPLPRALLSEPVIDHSRTPERYAWLTGALPHSHPRISVGLPHPPTHPSPNHPPTHRPWLSRPHAPWSALLTRPPHPSHLLCRGRPRGDSRGAPSSGGAAGMCEWPCLPAAPDAALRVPQAGQWRGRGGGGPAGVRPCGSVVWA